jgi:hypothetical protein
MERPHSGLPYETRPQRKLTGLRLKKMKGKWHIHGTAFDGFFKKCRYILRVLE